MESGHPDHVGELVSQKRRRMGSKEEQRPGKAVNLGIGMYKPPRVLTTRPLELFAHEHSVQRHLCDLLEQIADSLPENTDRASLEFAISGIDELYHHHMHEEKCLFPIIRKRAEPADNVDKILDHLALEHATDESLAAEIQEVLESLIIHRRAENPDILGFMLRGFFENYRRHIIWEDTVLFPVVQNRLTPDDLEELASLLHNAHAAMPDRPASR